MLESWIKKAKYLLSSLLLKLRSLEDSIGQYDRGLLIMRCGD